MEAARTSETLVNFYQTTRRYSPEDSHLRSHRRENLKSYLVNLYGEATHRYFGDSKPSLIALMMEAARTSETLVNFYQTTRRYNPEDRHLRIHTCVIKL
jgi:hypothetical protein